VLPVHVQSNAATGSGTSLAAAYAGDNTEGNLLIAACIGTADPSGVSDTAGNTWVSCGPATTITTDAVEIFYAANCLGGPNTVTMTAASSTMALGVLEYSGLALASVFGRVVNNTACSTTANTNPLLAGTLDRLLVTVMAVENMAGLPVAPGTNFTERLELATGTNGPAALHVQERIITTGGSYSGAATLPSSTNWVMQMASFLVPPSTKLYIRETYRPRPFGPGFGR
jgi:hypothetical protein